MSGSIQEQAAHNCSDTLVLELPDSFNPFVSSPYTSSLADRNDFYWELEHMEMFRHERFPIFDTDLDTSNYSFYAGICGEPGDDAWCAKAVSSHGALHIYVESEMGMSARIIRCTELTDVFLEDILAAAEAFYGQALRAALKTDINHDGSKRYLLTLRFSDKSTPD